MAFQDEELRSARNKQAKVQNGQLLKKQIKDNQRRLAKERSEVLLALKQ